MRIYSIICVCFNAYISKNCKFMFFKIDQALNKRKFYLVLIHFLNQQPIGNWLSDLTVSIVINELVILTWVIVFCPDV